ncbi:hypothetical protein CBG46_02440 [Actinobacillus succinogenes]|uniref:Integral membrane protein n=1 Tax=Actinobacillus succinogenes (strain ATCC 55618 / DSM 22257 / CCUG 43843 / 130Z) TaxID=339671 RepID=A6VLU7_ACTSZ|nr:DUF2301 domain-containing membrane protein [Actinobacillus succinogenes]ABR73944.1 conserved hypothetical protein [Actinobacillus succinogenes 130Z]PHI39612.1 hypothetical protein CBG46_02440 [Actinobacillus succinogenes]
MADPHIRSPMDFLDKLTVCLYRSGFIVAACALALLPYSAQWGYFGLLVAAALCASSLHIYLKSFRLLLQMATWLALLCHAFGQTELALGGVLLTLGGLAFKEYFCFRVWALNFMPLLVALLWLCTVISLSLPQKILSAACALLFTVLFIRKIRMPLHFDIGDKTKYQV